MAKKKNTEDDEVALVEGSEITKYNVRDAAGKMSFGITEAQKDKIVGAGGTVVNVIRTPGPVIRRPPPEEEPKVILPAPEEPILPKAELALPGREPPPEEEPEEVGVGVRPDQEPIVLGPPVEEEIPLPPPERETTRQRTERLAAERAAATKVAAEEEAYREAMDVRAEAITTAMRQEAARKLAEQEAVDAQRVAVEAKAAKEKGAYEVTKLAQSEAITRARREVAERVAVKKVADAEVAAKKAADEELSAAEKALADQTYVRERAAAEKAVEDVAAAKAAEAGAKADADARRRAQVTAEKLVATTKAEAETKERIAVGEMLVPITPPVYAEYTVTYTEKGVEKKKTFPSESAALAFQATLPKYLITYEGEDYGFQTSDEADKFTQDVYSAQHLGVSLEKFQTMAPEMEEVLRAQHILPPIDYDPTIQRYKVTYVTPTGERTVIFDDAEKATSFVETRQRNIMRDAGFVGTWEAFQRQNDLRLAALTKLATKGLIKETDTNTYEIAVPLRTLSESDLALVKEAGFDPVYPTPWLEQWFPQLADLREQAQFTKFKLWEDMTDTEKQNAIAAVAGAQEYKFQPEGALARLGYVTAYGAEGALIAGALTAITTVAPQVGIPITAALLLAQVSALSTNEKRQAFLDYVAANPEAFISEVLGGVIGTVAVKKMLTKPTEPQVTEMRRLEAIEEGVPEYKTTKTLSKEIADILSMERDPITGEEIIVGRLTETGRVIDYPTALKYGGDLYAKLMNNEPLGTHLVEETLMKTLTPEQLGYLSGKGYTTPVMSHMTGYELAQMLFKELGPDGPWANIPSGVLRVGGGRIEVIGIVSPLTDAQSTALLGKSQTFFNNMVSGGVDRQLALQITQLAMEQGPASALIFAQASGQVSVELFTVIEAALSPLASTIFSYTSKGSITQTLKNLGLSDSESLLVTAELIKSDQTANIVKSIQTLKGTELKGYIPNVDKGLLLESISKLDTKTVQKLVDILDTKTIVEIAPKIDADVLNSLVIAIDKERLDEVVLNLDKTTLKKLDDKALEKIATELNITSLEETIAKLDFNVMARIFPKLNLDKKAIRDILDKMDAETLAKTLLILDKETLENAITKLDKETLEKVLPELKGEEVTDVYTRIDTKLLKDALERLDKKEIEVIIPNIITELDTDTIADIIPILDTDTIADVLPILDADVIADIIPKLDDDTIEKIIPFLSDDTIISIVPMLSDITIQKLVPILEEKLEEGRFDYISRNLPMRLRRKFKRAMKKRKPRKLPPSEKPEPYRVMFQYVTGASETKRVDARTFHEALVIAQEQRQIALDPVEVEVEKIVPGTLGSVEIPPLEPLLTRATVGTGVPIAARVDRKG